MSEEWRDIVGHEGKLQVSNLGRIRSVARTNTFIGRWGQTYSRWIKSVIRVQTPSKGGYLGISGYLDDGKQVRIRTHIAVLEVFRGPRPGPDYDGCHDDGDNTNNVLDNLSWRTKSSNNMDKELHGTDQKGSRNGTAKLTEDQVRDIKRRLAAETLSALAREFDVSVTNIWQIKKGLKWQHV
jgi:hypothetical protein